MAVAAVLPVSCAALIARGAAKLGHHLARNRTMPDVGSAVGTGVRGVLGIAVFRGSAGTASGWSSGWSSRSTTPTPRASTWSRPPSTRPCAGRPS
ncbi:hypothetical protein [Streptomyces sp. NPDC056401]|uniref:hypothetical protein n=1 Tax=Streptomyces sp. NPDC056401 TaxID=3345809 RepID=UPI0035DABE2A